jgi:four helix bundle protein
VKTRGWAAKNCREWEALVPDEVTGDSLFRVEARRLGLFVADLGWYDATKLVCDRRTVHLSDQLHRALGSISANFADGYSRGTGKDRARFYEYGAGSARESRDWCYKARNLPGEAVAQHRLGLLTQIIRLLPTMIPEQRGRTLRDETQTYCADGPEPEPSVDRQVLDHFLRDVPGA